MGPTDTLRIESIETQAIIGVYEHEHETPQPLILDLDITTDFTPVFTSDDLKHSLDYDAITRHTRSFCQNSRYQLIESLAGGIIMTLMEHFPVDKVAVTIKKPLALTNALATVRCERTRSMIIKYE